MTHAVLAPTQPTQSRRAAVDAARGLALLSMLVAHGYDGWVEPGLRASLGYRGTRVIATLALPSFLLLAGLSLGLQVYAARGDAGRLRAVGASGVRRGLRLVLFGYGVSAATAWLDGARSLEVILRADVLHAIGLALAALAWLASRTLRPSERLDMQRVQRQGLALAAIALLMCPIATRFGATVRGPWRFALALLVDVPGLTRMPLVPLVSFSGVGLALGLRFATEAPSGTPSERRFALALLVASVLAIAASLGAAAGLSAWLGSPPSRANVGIYPNAVDLCARACALLAFAFAITPRLPRVITDNLTALGRHTLVLYALHLPLCYGRLARPFSHRLTLAEATAAFAVLAAACLLLARGLDRARSAARAA